jgi:hypothetical protein
MAPRADAGEAREPHRCGHCGTASRLVAYRRGPPEIFECSVCTGELIEGQEGSRWLSKKAARGEARR